MQLPARADGGVEIGISDILAWRDCATRAKFGRRRLEGREAPESWSPANAYGSAIHDCIAALDDGQTPEEAALAAMGRFKAWLEPADLSLLHDDLEKYQAREALGVRTLLNEGEVSILLFVHPTAGAVWLRGRIDRLYQDLNDPAVLTHLDWKSGKWPKSYEEVAEDLQLWTYNLLIVEWMADLYPEVENVRLMQIMDQLRYGQVPTQKSEAQRAEIRRWLVTAITAMIADEEESPTFNQWCPWCPLKMDCPVVQFELTEWATTRIETLMPREEKRNKDGALSKRQGPVVLDTDRIDEFVELLPDVHRAAQVLGTFEEEVRSVLKQMPETELARLGKRKVERSRRVFTTEAKRQIIELVGLPTALMLFDVSISGVERFYGEHSREAESIVELAETQAGATAIAEL
jgi:hypothetical protein